MDKKSQRATLFGVILLFCCCTPNLQAQYTNTINANRPSKSMGAFSVGKTVLQLETGGFYKDFPDSDTRDKSYGGELQFRYGNFFEAFELIANLEYTQFQNDLKSTGDLTQLILGAKYLLYDPFKNYEEKINVYSWKANQRFKWRRLVPAVSIYVGADFKTSKDLSYPDEPEVSPKVVLIAQQHFSEKWVLVTNIIGEKLSSNTHRGFGYILTLTHGFNSKWSAFVENQYFENDWAHEMNWRLGAATLLHKNLQLDFSVGHAYGSFDPSFIGQLGLSWRFDKNHMPIEL